MSTGTKTKRCRIVGESSIFRIGQPIAKDAASSSQATIDFRPYVVEGSFTFKNNVVDNSGQNVKLSKQYGQDEASAELTFFSVDDANPSNPLTILRKAKKDHLAVPIYFKEAETAAADGFDGDVIVEVAETPIPGSGEVKVKVSMHANNDYRIWESLTGVAPVIINNPDDP